VQSKIKAGDLDFLLMSVEDEPVAFLLIDIIIKFRSNALLSQPGSTLPSSFHCQAHGWTQFFAQGLPTDATSWHGHEAIPKEIPYAHFFAHMGMGQNLLIPFLVG